MKLLSCRVLNRLKGRVPTLPPSHTMTCYELYESYEP